MDEPQATPRRSDRRVERTRALLRDALMQLVTERPWESITVQDITDRANVNRATFYLHFRDKDELLVQGMIGLYAELMDGSKTVTREQLQAGDLGDLLDDSDFAHVQEHAAFYRAILGRHGSAGVVDGIQDFLTALMRDHVLAPLAGNEPPQLPLDFMAAYLAGAEIGLMRWWLKSGQQYAPPDMARMMFLMSSFGLLWALHLDPAGKSAAGDAAAQPADTP